MTAALSHVISHGNVWKAHLEARATAITRGQRDRKTRLINPASQLMKYRHYYKSSVACFQQLCSWVEESRNNTVLVELPRTDQQRNLGMMRESRKVALRSKYSIIHKLSLLPEYIYPAIGVQNIRRKAAESYNRYSCLAAQRYLGRR